jgi:3-mercaptopropionate dioxygenase
MPITPSANPDVSRSLTPLREFVVNFGRLLDKTHDEALILLHGGALLKKLVSCDDWLSDAYAQPHPTYYHQLLLHADSTERFSVVSFVWGPGQATPIHDHTVWGLIGMRRGGKPALRRARWQDRVVWTGDAP